MKIEKQIEGDNLTIKLEGRLDTSTAPDLENEVKNLDGVTNLELDFEKLEYISSAGLRVMLALQKTMNNQGRMVIKNANNDIQEVFEITGFSDIITLE